MRRPSRRSFLRTVAAAPAGIAAFTTRDVCAATKLRDAMLENASDKSVTWGKAPCRYCGTGCGVEVGVADVEGKKRVVQVRGDQKSPVNQGLLCAKGYHLPGFLYGEDRLLYPQRRKADGTLERMSWDDALDLIASKYKTALEKHGPEAVGVYGSGQWTIFDGYAALKWVKGGMRSNNLDPNARLCMASAVMGFVTTFQSDEPMGCYADFEAGDDFVLWGNNMAEMHPVLFSRILENKRKKTGVRIIDLATRRTATSEYADMYIEFTPGSDLAIANGILALLIKKDQVDHRFLRENCVFKRGIEDLAVIGYGCGDGQKEKYTFKDEVKDATYEDFVAFVSEYTPARVQDISGVSPEQLE
ncbi:MAG TPA: molybdopterin-dependent oxidoreductase, partial [Planctomycetota bacterium]|nr:molybdopterin-dependent oxidoreductase [Planctomycetota bacterium]